VYRADLEDTLSDEFIHFSKYVAQLNHTDVELSSPLFVYKVVNQSAGCAMRDTFPNVDIAYRIFLSMMATNCEG
jgi:hypothetical protein